MTDKTEKEVEVGPLSGKPPTEWQGPLRRAPEYYAGKTMGKRVRTRNGKVGGRPMLHADTQVKVDGTYGKKNKAARRLVRGAMKKSHSRAEKRVRDAQLLKQEAYSASWNGHEARRMLDKELAFRPTAAPQPPKRKAPIAAVQRHVRVALDMAIAKTHDKKEGE